MGRVGQKSVSSSCISRPPEEIGGNSERHQNKTGENVAKLFWIVRREVNCVADDGRRGDQEHDRRPRIAWHAVGNGLAIKRGAKRKDCGCPETVKNPSDKHDASGQLRKAPGK